MAIFDIRKDLTEPTTHIVFAERTVDDTNIAHTIVPWTRRSDSIAIEDGTSEKVVIVSKQHALYLIKALEKSITLGWLK